MAPTFGWSGHGRTTYLIALTDLLTRLNLVWPESSYREGDQPTRKFLNASTRLIRDGAMPMRGSKEQRDRFLLLLHGLGSWGDLALILSDCSGKHFGGLDVSSGHVPDVIRSPYVMMVISPADLKRDARRIDMLFNSYLDAIRSSEVSAAAPARGIVVTLTKADLIQRQLPERVVRYLREDELSTILRPHETVLEGTLTRTIKLDDRGLKAYLDRMNGIHEELSDWLVNDPYFRGLETKARRAGIEVRFSAVSALGEPVQNDNTLPVLWRPRRVLDPFFWLLQLEDEHSGLTEFLTELGEAGSPFHLSFSVQDIHRKASAHHIDLGNDSTGDLSIVDANLVDVKYHHEPKGIYFQLTSPTKMSIRRDGEWNHGQGSTVLLRPGDALIVRDWQIDLCATTSRSKNS